MRQKLVFRVSGVVLFCCTCLTPACLPNNVNLLPDLACDPKEPDSKGDWATNEGIVLTNIWTTVGPLLELQQQHCCWDRETQFCRVR